MAYWIDSKNDFHNIERPKDWRPSTFWASKDKNDNFNNCYDYFILEKNVSDHGNEYYLMHAPCSGGAFYGIFSTSGHHISPIVNVKKDMWGNSDPKRKSFKICYYNPDKEKLQIEDFEKDKIINKKKK